MLACSAFFVAIALIRFPAQSYEASIRGLEMWWEIVFPSLLPFFVTAELLIGFGVVRFIGILCEPIMRPVFKVPGAGSFVWAMGMASGYPSGAKLTARLRQEGQLTKIEAERLVSFTNASNPLFIFAAISVGFFNDPKLGILIAVSHYVGNTLVGICMRFYGKDEERKQERFQPVFSVKRAMQALHTTRVEDGRPFGKLFGDAVLSSIQTLLIIGGFIILFSVLNQLLYLVNVTPLIGSGIAIFFQLLGVTPDLTIPFISGLFEITLGAQLTSEVDTYLLQQAMCVSFILAFNGFSVQAQVASILAETDIPFTPYFIARLLHGVFAVVLTYMLYTPLYVNNTAEQTAIPAFLQKGDLWNDALLHMTRIGPPLTLITLLIGIFLLWAQVKRRPSKRK